MAFRRRSSIPIYKLNFFIFLFLLILILNPILLQADTGLELIHADKQVTKEVNGELLNVFEGKVHFRQDTMEMFCDDAILYEQKNKLQFNGNVLITDSHSRIRAQKINYFTETRIAYCYDYVRIKAPNDTLYAEYLKYDFKTGEADAHTNLYMFNIENNVQIWGQEGSYNPNTKHNQIRENARFIKVDTTSGDTLNITAFQLEYYGGEEKRAVATDSVIILQGALKAVCDSAVYHTETEFVSLYGSPYAWYKENELSGVFMQARFDSLKLQDIIVSEEAKAISPADSISEKENILKGNKIHFEIENNKPKLVTATDNATSIYYLQTEDNKNQGCNYATSDTILVYFAEGKLDSITIKGGSEGIYYPNEFKGKKVFEDERQ